MIKAFERMTIEAAVKGDRNLAVAALNLNPKNIFRSFSKTRHLFDKYLFIEICRLKTSEAAYFFDLHAASSAAQDMRTALLQILCSTRS